MTRESIGELEHLILLTILNLRPDAGALDIRRVLKEEGRSVTRGALYRSLDRLGEKGLIEWAVQEPEAGRGGHARRLYQVSPAGLRAVRERRQTLERLWVGAGEVAGP